MGLLEVAIYLAAAVVVVPFIRRAGFGDVLGYLMAGVVTGPFVFAVVENPKALLHFAEIGVVFLLFVIGLELRPSRLKVFRHLIFGVGLAQVVITTVVLTAIARLLGAGWAAALVVGLALSLSSTAMVVQLLSERRELLMQHGRAAFGVLLFQDMAVVPMLAFVQVLSGGGVAGASVGEMAVDGLVSTILIVLVLLVAQRLLRPALNLIAANGSQDLFTAFALLLVVGAGLGMEAAGLSMGLGAFIAGVLVADSEYRYQLETDITPFKGLLLGFFFMAVGMSADLGLLAERPLVVLGLSVGLILVKAALVFGLALALGYDRADARRIGLRLAQGGEFAFVLFAAAEPSGLISSDLAALLVLVVTLSMAATPLVQLLEDRLVGRASRGAASRAFDEVPLREHRVILAGFGRFGQIVGRLLAAHGIPFTALENSASHVDFVRRYGSEVFYGDPRRLDLLRNAHADEAEIFILAVDDVETSLAIAQNVRRHFSHLEIYARARNRHHALQLRALGAKVIVRESLPGSLELGAEVLQGLGYEPAEVARAIDIFRQHDMRLLDAQFAIRDDQDALIQSQRQAEEELRFLFESDRQKVAEQSTLQEEAEGRQAEERQTEGRQTEGRQTEGRQAEGRQTEGRQA